MAIRHFRKRQDTKECMPIEFGPEEKDTDGRRDDEDLNVDESSLRVQKNDGNTLDTAEESDCEDSESESEDSGSSSEEEITYHKPVLIRKNKSKKDNDSPAVEQISQTAQSCKNDMEVTRLNKRIEHSRNVTKAMQELQSNIDENYTTTDKELLKKIILLDDNDSMTNPAEELAKWEQRQRKREQRERDILVQRQLALEEAQARAMTTGADLTKNTRGGNTKEENIKTITKKRKLPTDLQGQQRKQERDGSFKPQRTKQTEFKNNASTETDEDALMAEKENNEYSIH